MNAVLRKLFIGLLYAGTALLMSCHQGTPVEPVAAPASDTPDFLRVPADQGLHKILFVADTITVKNGGTITVKDSDFDSVYSKRVFRIKIELYFAPYTVSNDFLATLSTDAQYLMSSLDLLFGPHGTTFIRPAQLRVFVKGMDLSAFPQGQTFHLYYLDHGWWVRMEGNVAANVYTGELVCSNGRLPHFSRYAFGR